MNNTPEVWDSSILPDVPLSGSIPEEKTQCLYSEETKKVLLKFVKDLRKEQTLGTIDDSYYDVPGEKEVFVVEVDDIEIVLQKHLGTYQGPRSLYSNKVLVGANYRYDTHR